MKEFEQNIKQQLEERRITPSAEAWEKIQEEIKPKKASILLIWKSVAAVFILTGAIAFFIINSQQEKPEANAVNQTKKGQSQIEQNMPILENIPEVIQNIAKVNKEKEEKSFSGPVKNENIDKVQYTENKVEKEENRINSIEKTNIKNEVRPDIPVYVNTDAYKTVQQIQPIKKPETYVALNEDSSSKPKVGLIQKSRKTNPDKLLFYIENEKQLKKPSRIAFRNNTIQYDISEN